MTQSIRLATATALLGLALSGSVQASLALPYAYAAAADVDDPNTLVEGMTFFGMGSALAQIDFSWARTEMGVHHAEARGDESTTRYGALSAWADGFTVTGGIGSGLANVSMTLDGAFGASSYAAAGYALIKAAYPVLPMDLISYISGGSPLPADVEVVMWSLKDSIHNAGAINTVMTGSFNFDYNTPFYLTSVFGVMASGIGHADFSNTGTFGITLPGNLVSDSGTGYMAAAVPEAHEWALMMAGLGLIGLRARRWKKTQRIVA